MPNTTFDPDLNPWDESQVVDDWDDESLDGSIQLVKRPLEDSEMDITPMIDMTFLLLIFFLVASNRGQDSQVPLPPARHGVGVTTQNSTIITVVRGSDDSVVIYKGDTTDEAARVTSTDLAEQEQELIAYISERADTKKQVIIKAEREVRARELTRVARAVGAVDEIESMYVAVKERN